MNRNKRLIILSILSVLIVILVTIGVTTAFMKPIEEGGNLTSVSLSSCAKITLEGTNSISLSNSYPMSKNRALQTTPYSFKVTTSCDTYVGFNLYLATLSSNTMDASNIHYIITNKGSKDILSEGTLTSSLVVSGFSDTEITELNAGLGSSYGVIYKLFNEKVPYQGSVEYDLYLYVDESVTSVSGTFQAGVAIKSYEREKDITLAEWVKSKYTGTQGENAIYYHDSTLANGAGDNSYRYAGSSDTTNNFVCFGSDAATCPDDNLYRIIGVFGEQVKLIKWDYATSTLLGTDGDYYKTCSEAEYCGGGTYGTSKGTNTEEQIGAYYWNYANYSATYSATNYYNVWSYSKLNTVNLNTNFLNNIGTEWSSKIAETTWKVGGITYNNIIYSNAKTAYTNEITNPDATIESTYKAKVALMYTSDYGFAASPSAWTSTLGNYNSYINNNWMYMGLWEWTVVRQSANSNRAFSVLSDGSLDYLTVNNSDDAWGVRPVFHLESSVNYGSGSGAKADPVRLS